MGDVPPQPTATGLSSQEAQPAQYATAGSSFEGQQGYVQGKGTVDPSSAYSPQVPQQYANPQHTFTTQFDMAQQPQGPGRTAPYNMSVMAAALPQANYRPGQYTPSPQRFNPAASSPSMAGQMPVSHLPPYPGQTTMSPIATQPYYMPQHTPMGQYYGAPLSPSQQQAAMSPRGSIGYYPNQVVMNPQQPQMPATYYYPQPTHYPTQGQILQGQALPGQYVSPAPQLDPRAAQAQVGDHFGSAGYGQGQDRHSSTDGRSNVVRGPPRKPKQSGHAIWIGNLPPQTELMSLVHHVCKETPGLESLFLISKSNCAFANFKDEAACLSAQQKLHDSKFQSVRLVSRLRKSTVEGAAGVTAPTGPASSTARPTTTPDGKETEKAEEGSKPSSQAVGPVVADSRSSSAGEGSQQKDKFFILKSLTVEDLELSVRTGIWATQAHNEETLNNAFEAADNVYLVFSANKSGEYFGYARMVSPINEDPAAAIEFAPKAQSASEVDLPKAIPTEATESAPRGRIIDDSARGTIFWEAEREDGDESDEAASAGEVDGASTTDSTQDGGETKAWGKPFKLEWLSTSRLPFYRTRGVRNPWNSNREVKIARDGTELEPTVGRRLIGLFNRVQSPGPGPGMRQQGMPPLVPGYPPMRPPYQQ